jgi:hypothetical protein
MGFDLPIEAAQPVTAAIFMSSLCVAQSGMFRVSLGCPFSEKTVGCWRVSRVDEFSGSFYAGRLRRTTPPCCPD